ncbi:MAG: hypothetical protein DI556_13395 [Rhodovulum sulfidophilum]|uniref:Uncharacterized protein n=1 Tax=Rhodovulum sulfidophilum TaxID=35806 RepID=A0A2W5N6T5_RHOSU|nr:MAG: hypothetical protein DI556_13395 [Rhodovulum sulfidophilum]
MTTTETSEATSPDRPPARPSAAVAISLFAATLSFATAVLVLRSPAPLDPPVLVYDEAGIIEQIRPFVEAGYVANDVIERAFSRALERGHLILRRSDDVAGGPALEFRVADFVALPEGVRPPGSRDGPLATPLPPRDIGRVLSEPVPEEMRGLFDMLPATPGTAPGAAE